jgi:hypothetical protein
LWRRQTEIWNAWSGRDDSGKISSFGSGLLLSNPPLRELPEDIKKLTLFYMNDLCERFGIIPKAAICSYSGGPELFPEEAGKPG